MSATGRPEREGTPMRSVAVVCMAVATSGRGLSR
jgi:hypothetical protein